MGGPRNNLSRHPAEIRFRVYALHYEGKTAAEINADPAVAASVSMTGYRLHGNTLTAAFRSAEYKRYIASRERTFAATEADRITQAVLGEAGALSSVTDVARYELAREIRELIDSGPDNDESPVERVKRLTRSLATVSRDETARLRQENDALRRQLEKLQAENSELRSRIEQMPADNTRTIAEIDRLVRG